jgi:hypothetical protein
VEFCESINWLGAEVWQNRHRPLSKSNGRLGSLNAPDMIPETRAAWLLARAHRAGRKARRIP